MNLQTQFQMEDIRKKREQANKTKSSAAILIIIGSVSLLFAGGLFLLALLPSGTSDTSWVSACCFGIAILFGLVGILLIPIGLVRRHSGNQELASAEEDNRMLRMQMIAEEERKKQL